MTNIHLKLRRGMAGKTNQKMDCKQLVNPAVWREYKRTAEKQTREIIKQPFANIESQWEKIKRAIQEASKETLGYGKRAAPVEWLTEEMVNTVEEGRKLKSK